MDSVLALGERDLYRLLLERQSLVFYHRSSESHDSTHAVLRQPTAARISMS
jgi:hypothetical protein